MKRFYLFFVLAALIVFGQTAQAESSYSAVWKIAHNETERGSDHFFAVKFKDLVEQKSGGNIKVDIFPLGTLGDGSSNLEMLQEGGVEFAIADSGYIGSFVPESQLFRVHFLLTDDMALNRKLLKGKAMDIMNAEFLKNGMQVMLHFQKGFVNWTGNKPFRTLADFKGLKMRTVPAPILIEIYKLYGANPTAVNYAELYSALQLGLVEAQENDLTPIEELKLNEVQKVLTVSNHYSFIMTCVVNPAFYSSLPADVQQMLTEIFNELDEDFEVFIKDYTDGLLRKIKDEMGMEVVTLTPEERAAFREFNDQHRKSLEPILGKTGTEIMYTLQEEIKALGK